MAVTPTSFRADFPAFVDATNYPDSAITFWTTVALQFLNAERWDTAIDIGTELFVAHNLVLEFQANTAAGNGAAPGLSQGMISSKSVDKVSISYDTGSAAELDAGHWNLTIYGQRYVRMARMMGAGGIQLGIGYDPNFSAASGAWPGPYWPFG